MRTSLPLLTALAAATLLAACAAAPDTASIQALIEKNNDDTKAFAAAVDTATDAKVLAEALTAYAAASKAYPADFKAEMDKHPEFAAQKQGSISEGLKAALAAQAEAKQMALAAVNKLNASPLLADAEVQAAYQALADAAGTK